MNTQSAHMYGEFHHNKFVHIYIGREGAFSYEENQPIRCTLSWYQRDSSLPVALHNPQFILGEVASHGKNRKYYLYVCTLK